MLREKNSYQRPPVKEEVTCARSLTIVYIKQGKFIQKSILLHPTQKSSERNLNQENIQRFEIRYKTQYYDVKWPFPQLHEHLFSTYCFEKSSNKTYKNLWNVNSNEIVHYCKVSPILGKKINTESKCLQKIKNSSLHMTGFYFLWSSLYALYSFIQQARGSDKKWLVPRLLKCPRFESWFQHSTVSSWVQVIYPLYPSFSTATQRE